MRIAPRITLWLALVPLSALGAPKAATPPKKLPSLKIMTTLGVIDGEADAKSSTITVRLDKKPAWESVPELQDHGAFLQLVLPETIVPEPGKFFDGGSPYVPKIAVFQLTPSEAGIRFFLTSDAAKTRAALATALLDSRIVLTLDHQKLETTLALAKPKAVPAPSEVPATAKPVASEAIEEIPDYVDALAKVESAESVIARTQVDRELPPPAEVLKAVEPALVGTQTAEPAGPATGAVEATAKPAPVALKLPSPAKAPAVKSSAAAVLQASAGDAASSERAPGSSGIDLREKLVQVTIFLGAMIGLLLLSFVMRSLIRRRQQSAHGDDPISMKMLANLPLAARQKLSLIQVGDERILVGVTPESVTFIANLSKQAAPAGFGKLLAQADQLAAPARETRTLPMTPSPSPPRPKLKDLPGNDEESLRESPAPRPEALAQKPAAALTQTPRKPSPQRVNIAVGDDGPKEIQAVRRGKVDSKEPASRESVDDVTKMIRDKLRQLKSI